MARIVTVATTVSHRPRAIAATVSSSPRPGTASATNAPSPDGRGEEGYHESPDRNRRVTAFAGNTGVHEAHPVARGHAIHRALGGATHRRRLLGDLRPRGSARLRPPDARSQEDPRGG